MARTFVRPTDLALGSAGALGDDGTQSLAVKVDGVTVTINGSNQLVAAGGGGSTAAGIATSTALTTTAPLAGGGLLSSGLTLSIPVATSTANGYLASADWLTFNGKLAGSTALATMAPITGGAALSTGITIAMPPATSTANGYLTSADWITFNSKQSTGNFLASSTAIATTAPLTGGAALSTGVTLGIPQSGTTANGYLSSTDWNTFNNKTTTAVATATHQVGLSSSAGTATTAMRSDATLQLDQSIAPTMTGAWVFASTVAHTSRFLEVPVILVPSGTVTVDTSIGNTFTLLASTNFTLQAINGIDGVVSRFRVKQNGTGGWTITLGSTFNFGTDLVSSSVTISSTANKTSYIAAMYNSTSGLFDVMGALKGF